MYFSFQIRWCLLVDLVAQLALASNDHSGHDVNDASNLLRVVASRMVIDHRHPGGERSKVRNTGGAFPLQLQRAGTSEEDTNGNEAAGDFKEAKQFIQPIPRVVHHVFFNYNLAKNLSSREAWPNDVWFQSYLSWKKHFPDAEYQHIFWSADELEHFFKANCSKHWRMYQRLQHKIEKSDMSRYCLLWRFGGIYTDLDYEPMRNFYHLLRPGQVNLIQSPYVDETVQNSLMASPKSHPFWDQLMSRATARLGSAVQKVIDYNADRWQSVYDQVRRESHQTWPEGESDSLGAQVDVDSDSLGAQLLRSQEMEHVLWSSGPAFLSSFIQTVKPSTFHVLPCSQFQPLVRSGSKSKHCAKLSIAGIVNNTIQGIHWGTQLWSGGNKGAVAVFESFHQSVLAIESNR